MTQTLVDFEKATRAKKKSPKLVPAQLALAIFSNHSVRGFRSTIKLHSLSAPT